jgi:two-component system sensor histidine kinase YesM
MSNVYRDAVEYRIEVEPEIARAECLKAVLQPFVENSIKHGLEKTGQSVNIAVHAGRLDERMVRIDLEDNGTGLSDEKLAELQDALAKEQPDRSFNQLSSVGILNVCYRIKTYYPAGIASLTMNRSSMGGLKVSLIIPYRRKEERQ